MNKLQLNKFAFLEAIEYFGGQKKLGQICGIVQQAVSKFYLGQLPNFRPEYALRIQKASQGKISAFDLMPYYDWHNI